MKIKHVFGVLGLLGAWIAYVQFSRLGHYYSGLMSFYSYPAERFEAAFAFLCTVPSLFPLFPRRYYPHWLFVFGVHVFLHFGGQAFDIQALFLIENLLIAVLAVVGVVVVKQGRAWRYLKRIEPSPLVMFTSLFGLVSIMVFHLAMDMLWLALQCGWLDEISTWLWLTRLRFGLGGAAYGVFGVCMLFARSTPPTPARA